MDTQITYIGKSVVIKGEVSCGEDLYIDGQVEGTVDPKGNRLTIGPNGRVKANVNAGVVVVEGKLEGVLPVVRGRRAALGIMLCDLLPDRSSFHRFSS